MALSNALLERVSDVNTGVSSLATSSLSSATDVSRIIVLSVYDDGFTGTIGFSGDGLTYSLVDDSTGVTNGPPSPIVHRIYHANGSPSAGAVTVTFTSDTMDYVEMSVFQVSGSSGAVTYEGLLVAVTNGVELTAGNSYDFTMTTSGGGTGNGLWAYASCPDDTDNFTTSRTGWTMTSSWDTANALVFHCEAVQFSADDDTSCVFEKTATSASQYAVGLVMEFSEASGTTVVAGTAALTFTTYAPTITAQTDLTVTPGTASLTLDGLPPTIAVTGNLPLTAGTAVLSFTTYAPSIGTTTTETIVTGTALLSFTGNAPSVDISANPGSNTIINPGTSSLTFTGQAPDIAISVPVIVAGTASLTFTAYAPNIQVGTSLDIVAGTASLSFSGIAPVITQTTNWSIVAGTAELTFDGQRSRIFGYEALPLLGKGTGSLPPGIIRRIKRLR